MTDHPNVTAEATSPVKAGPEGGLHGLRVRCRRILGEARSREDLLRELGRAVAQTFAAEQLLRVVLPGSGSTEPRVEPLNGRLPEGSTRTVVLRLAEAISRHGAPQVARPTEGPGRCAVGAQIPNTQPNEVLVALCSGDVRIVPVLAEALDLVADAVHWWDRQDSARDLQSDFNLSCLTVDLITRVQNEADDVAARQRLVDELAEHLPDTCVVLASARNRNGSQLAAHSRTELDLEDRDLQRLVLAACDEGLLRGTLSTWPAPQDCPRHALLAHRQLAERTTAVATVPLTDSRDRSVGTLLILGEAAAEPSTHRLLRAAARPVGSCLALWERARSGPLVQTVETLRSSMREMKGKLLAMLAVILLVAMFVPVTYRVKCDCEVQPYVRRFVAAPFDGRLERAFVKPGDVVAADQLLARMDGHEIRWELAGVAADLNRAATERAGYLAGSEPGPARIAQYEMERLQLKLELLEYRSAHLDIRSPLEGIVIAGDHEKSEGVPLETGQTLFEIAPLERMTVELQIPEEDISQVEREMTVRLTFEAFPSRTWEARLLRIHPRSEPRDRQHVFIAEVELPNADALLRPGMRGRAAIVTEPHPLGWNLFHKAWNRCLLWLGW